MEGLDQLENFLERVCLAKALTPKNVWQARALAFVYLNAARFPNVYASLGAGENMGSLASISQKSSIL